MEPPPLNRTGTYDVLVIGAGPAGGAAALAAAAGGARTLLVDRAIFPRPKVCGGCVGPAALAELERLGLPDLVRLAGARRLHRLEIRTRRRLVRLDLPGGVALSRAALDAALVEHAVARGATFRPGTIARIGAPDGMHRCVALNGVTVRAGIVIAADGLTSRSSPRSRNDERVAPDARLGLGTILPRGADAPPSGTIRMAIARGGYVGSVTLEDGRTALAAAVDPALVRTERGPTAALAALLSEAGAVVPGALAEASVVGTPLLTRTRRDPAAERLLYAGDAARYVEPFTGEGIGWALAAGRAAGVLAATGWQPTTAFAWRASCRSAARRARRCAALARLLRHPLATDLVLATLARTPRLSARVARVVHPAPSARPA